MKFQTLIVYGLFVLAYLIVIPGAPASHGQTGNPSGAKPMTITFGGIDYLHRWSKNGQNEFTPQSEGDLTTWRNMVTVNVHETVKNGDQLAALANRILGNYQSRGKILRTDSKPRTQTTPAEHLVVAVLGDPGFLEAAFARFVLIDGLGVVAVYSHRVYGKQAGPAMSQWLEANGQQIEKTLMAWDKVPAPASLKQLPQSK